jgi:hypothetical protein
MRPTTQPSMLPTTQPTSFQIDIKNSNKEWLKFKDNSLKKFQREFNADIHGTDGADAIQ